MLQHGNIAFYCGLATASYFSFANRKKQINLLARIHLLHRVNWVHFQTIKKVYKLITGGNVTVITALANSTVSLPCDISIPNAHERVTFILWYREDLGIPIFR